MTVEAEDGTATYDFVIMPAPATSRTRRPGPNYPPSQRISRCGGTGSPAGRAESETLGVVPYLGPGYQLTEREPGQAPWLANIHVFSIGLRQLRAARRRRPEPAHWHPAPRSEAIVRDLVIADLIAPHGRGPVQAPGRPGPGPIRL